MHLRLGHDVCPPREPSSTVIVAVSIAARYRKLQLFVSARGRAISDGIAAARALEEAKKGGK